MSMHIDSIIDGQSGSQIAQVVFIDIVKYSLRNSRTQRRLIDKFTEISQNTLGKISEKYVKYAQ